jgi:hypothetical protein
MIDQGHNAGDGWDLSVRHPRASLQRQRAASLRAVAVEIDATVIAQLDRLVDLAAPDLKHSVRGRLCLAMLDRHLGQLHAAVDELRDLAFRCSAVADQLECGGRRRPR